ncbi:VWA domain-containing protein [archaeon]|nr:VWA domain-containing protein [archaeon]
MNKALTILLVSMIILSTVITADKLVEAKEEQYVVDYFIDYPECGPNDIQCNNPQIDVVFVIDSTGSMHDEIRSVKEELTNIINNINQGYPRPDVRIGVVTYRDYEPEEQEYLTRELGLTSSTWSAVRFIRNMNANGGGDYEEAVEAGLNEAINDMKWRKSSQKIIILVGDAPARDNPNYENHGNQPEYYTKYNWEDAIDDAEDKGIRIYTASGSGMNSEGISQWKKIAKETGGRYIKLIYERRMIDDYYLERAIPVAYAEEARASVDYDAATDSVMTNNLGAFTKATLQSEAEQVGVEYEDPLSDITGGIIREPPEKNLKTFLEEIFQKLKFW